jgi:hypothetical protein
LSFYLEAKAGVELVNSGGLLVGEAADDKDDHCAHSALVVPTQGGELKHNEGVAAENVRASRGEIRESSAGKSAQSVPINMCTSYCVFSRVAYFVE